MTDTPTKRIRKAMKQLGNDLSIMAHHYQNDDVIQHAHLRGDSLELARQLGCVDARDVVFCGVYFMAETAAILASPGQRIHIPDASARCVMAAMSPVRLLEAVLDNLCRDGRRIIPLTYVNSRASVKALCGARGGSVCTSANARTMLKWALAQGDGVLFLPDRNLAHNTADRLDIPDSKRHVLDIRDNGRSMDAQAAAKADLIIWPGCCAIHARMKKSLASQVRRLDPDARIIVHPECPPELVRVVDASGSTSAIIRYVAEAPEGTTIYVGTEINLVQRLAAEYKGSKSVRPLTASACSNMAKISEQSLARQVEAVTAGAAGPGVTVDRSIAEPAKVALERMLEACA